jgi:hypothetical protein
LRDAVSKNAKIIWLAAIVAVVILALVLEFRDIFLRTSKVVTCDDGSRRTIDIREFSTKYSAYSVELEVTVADKAKISTKLNPEQLQQLSESLQSANEFRKYLVAGFNSCAISKAKFAQDGTRFQAMDNLAHEINELVGDSSPSQQQIAKLTGLIHQYDELAGKLGTE